MSPQISIDRETLAEFCRKHYIKRLAIFGSALRDDFRPDSDVDVLVEFQPGRVPGLDFVTIERELSGSAVRAGRAPNLSMSHSDAVAIGNLMNLWSWPLAGFRAI
jgi:predicted nucleotidyltransferase